MKFSYIKFITFATLVTSMLVMACEKEKEIIAPWVEGDADMAGLRIVHASPNFTALTGVGDFLNIYANGVKINGARLSFGSFYPAQTPSTYINLAPGAYDIKITVGGTVNPDSIPVATLKFNLQKGIKYSFVITDSVLNASKDSTRIFVADALPTTDNGRVGLRFVNALVDTPGKLIDIWSARRNANLYSNLPMGAVTGFSNQPFINLSDTLIIRRSGSTLELARLNTIVIPNQKVYTFYARGDVKLTTGTKARSVSWYTNR